MTHGAVSDMPRQTGRRNDRARCGKVGVVVTLRPMEEADVPGAVAAFDAGFGAMRARYGLPELPPSAADDERRQNRVRHFLRTDPGGSWVAEEDGVVVAMSQSFVREGYWVLSQLGAVPERQDRGLGRELLGLALSHGEADSPGTIQCSRDPRAMALYTGAGFSLHPVVVASGPLRAGALPRPAEVIRHEGPEVTGAHVDVITSIDRAVRGSARPVDMAMMLAEDGARLLLHEDQAYAVAKHGLLVTMGGRTEASATLVLRALLAEVPAGETVAVNWLTSAQQWAISVLVEAGVELIPHGPVMVRGRPGPPHPYIPSGGYG
jgi:ribosomal protein S18 acetylase RimI-like enzyme